MKHHETQNMDEIMNFSNHSHSRYKEDLTRPTHKKKLDVNIKDVLQVCMKMMAGKEFVVPLITVITT